MTKLKKRADGRYCKQIYLGRDENGKRLYKTVYGKTISETAEKERTVRTDMGCGLDLLLQNDDFSIWADDWLRTKLVARITAKQKSNYKRGVKFWKEAFTGYKIGQINAEMIEYQLVSMQAANYAMRTINFYRSTIGQIMRRAVGRAISSNPVDLVVLTAPGKKAEKRRALELHEQQWIWETPHRAQPVAIICMLSGLRRGELAALTWDDVDLDRRTIAVNKVIEYPPNEPPRLRHLTKPVSGMRTVDIPQRLADYMRTMDKSNSLVIPSAHGMAILKHKTSKNARYADVLDYYTYKHEESQKTGHYEPILDENGLMIERDDYAVTYITAQGEEADPELWAAACMRTNILFRKNLAAEDRKNHEYILAHPTEDHITVEQLLEEGRAFARDNLFGYDCLIGAHDNHVHVTINSVRALRREREEDWMMRDKVTGEVLPCEMDAGGKHQDSPVLRMHMNDWLLEYTRQHGFVQKDNNAIAAVHRAERHGTKNDRMKAALLEAAGRSQNMADLRRIMKEEYDMDLKASESGKTISVLYPGNEKYVRLRTLELEPADLTRCFIGTEYVFTKETEAQQIQKEVEAREKKKYIEWIRIVRDRNNEKAEMAAARAEKILARQLRGRGERYAKEEFQDIRYLIRQTAYVSANLQTELEKVDRLLGRWDQYHDTSLSTRERRQHGGYIRWCGCDPDCAEELEDLRVEREVILAQREHADAMSEALTAEEERWRGLNNLTYAMNSLAWTEQREKQLKQQLKSIKASRKKLWEISCNCERAAMRYDRKLWQNCAWNMNNAKNPKWENVYKFRGKWAEAVRRERECQKRSVRLRKKRRRLKCS